MTSLVERFVEQSRLLAESKGRRFRINRPPRGHPPDDVERAYRAYLFTIVRGMREAVEDIIVPELPGLVAASGQRADARYNLADIEAAISKMGQDVRLRLSARNLRGLEEKIREYRSRVSLSSSRQLQRQISRMISLDAYPSAGSAEAALLDSWVEANRKRIIAMSNDEISKVEDIVRRNVQAGYRASHIQGLIAEQWPKVQNRAALIARDQVNKLHGNLTRVRQTSVGIKKYRWRTSRDERVRASHAAKEDKIFEWDDPPSDTGHPGQDINCRCTAEPVIEEPSPVAAFARTALLTSARAGASAAITTATGAFGLASGLAAGTAGAAAGAATGAAVGAAAGALVPAAAWRFPGQPWVASATTPMQPFDAQRLSTMLEKIGPEDISTATQIAIRRELNALMAEDGLTSIAIQRGLPATGVLKMADLWESGIAALYETHTGQMEVDRSLMQMLSRAVEQGVPVELNPIFQALVHETLHSATPFTKFGEVKGIKRLVEEMSNEYSTQVLLNRKFGQPVQMFTTVLSPYSRWAQETVDAISDSFKTVETGLKTSPSFADIQNTLSDFFLRWRRISSFRNKAAVNRAYMEGFFPNSFFPGMTPKQIDKVRAKLFAAWKNIMQGKGFGFLDE